MLGLITLAAGIPTTIGVAQAVSSHRNAEREAKLTQKCNLLVYCDAKSRYSKQVHMKPIWLWRGKMWVSEGPPRLRSEKGGRGGEGGGAVMAGAGEVVGEEDDPGHAFEGFYINFPREPDKPMGLVSMTSASPPAMGWIYVDRDTSEVRYGKRSTSLPHIVGEWGWTKDEVGVTLNGIEGFVVVEEEEGVWAVYWDGVGDGRGLPRGKKVLEVSLERRAVEEVVDGKIGKGGEEKEKRLKTGDGGVKSEGRGLGGNGKIAADVVAQEGGKTRRMKT